MKKVIEFHPLLRIFNPKQSLKRTLMVMIWYIDINLNLDMSSIFGFYVFFHQIFIRSHQFLREF